MQDLEQKLDDRNLNTLCADSDRKAGDPNPEDFDFSEQEEEQPNDDDYDYVVEDADMYASEEEDISLNGRRRGGNNNSTSSLGGDSDDSSGGWTRKRKRAASSSRSKKKKEVILPPRPENVMTKKLRSAGPTAEELERQLIVQQQQEEAQKQKAAARAARAKSKLAETNDANTEPGNPSAGPVDSIDGEGDSESGSFSSDLGDIEPENIEPKREIGEEQAAADLASIYSMWEFISVIEFIFTFRRTLQLQTELSASSLACALVRSPGPGLLADLHIELLTGILSNTRTLSPSTWAAHFANRLRHEGSALSSGSTLPFKPIKGQEVHDYAELAATQRVLALKALCDIRMNREDLRQLAEAGATAKPAPPRVVALPPPGPSAPSQAGGRRTTRGASGSSQASAGAPPKKAQRGSTRAPDGDGQLLTLEEVRKEPLGTDSSGNTYWLFDCWDSIKEGGVNYGVSLYREHPSTVPKQHALTEESPAINGGENDDAVATKANGKGGKGKGKTKKLSKAEQERRRLAAYCVPPQSVPGRWEKLAESVEEIEALGAKLKRSLKKPDADMAAKLLDLVVPSIKERYEQEERWQKAKEKTAKALGSMWSGMEAHGRSMRQRKTIDYSLDAYDKEVKNAIRAQNRREDPPERPSRMARPEATTANAANAVEKRQRRRLNPTTESEEEEEREEESPHDEDLSDSYLEQLGKTYRRDSQRHKAAGSSSNLEMAGRSTGRQLKSVNDLDFENQMKEALLASIQQQQPSEMFDIAIVQPSLPQSCPSEVDDAQDLQKQCETQPTIAHTSFEVELTEATGLNDSDVGLSNQLHIPKPEDYQEIYVDEVVVDATKSLRQEAIH